MVVRQGTLQVLAAKDPAFPAQYDSVIKATADFEATHPSPKGVTFGLDSHLMKTAKVSMVRLVAEQLALAALVEVFKAQRSTGAFPETYAFPSDKTEVSTQLRYKKSMDGFRLYWVGENGVDDGGQDRLGAWYKSKTSDDWGFLYSTKEAVVPPLEVS